MHEDKNCVKNLFHFLITNNLVSNPVSAEIVLGSFKITDGMMCPDISYKVVSPRLGSILSPSFKGQYFCPVDKRQLFIPRLSAAMEFHKTRYL